MGNIAFLNQELTLPSIRSKIEDQVKDLQIYQPVNLN